MSFSHKCRYGDEEAALFFVLKGPTNNSFFRAVCHDHKFVMDDMHINNKGISIEEISRDEYEALNAVES